MTKEKFIIEMEFGSKTQEEIFKTQLFNWAKAQQSVMAVSHKKNSLKVFRDEMKEINLETEGF